MNNLRFFDFEVFPEWWCVVISDEEEQYPGGIYNNQFDDKTEQKIKSKMRVYSSDNEASLVREQLKKELSQKVICGYNIKRYDLMIAKCIFAGFTPRKLYIANQILVGAESPDLDGEHMRIASFIKFGWNGYEAMQDLMDDSDKGLKDKECSLGMDIRETTVPFGKVNLTQDDKDSIIFYCKHDVYALHVFYQTTSKAYVDTKIQLCKTFGLDEKVGYKNSNAVLCGEVLKAERIHGTTVTDPTITIRDEKLKAYFEKWLPANIYNHLLTKQESLKFELFDNIVDIGDGGLHSVYKIPKIGRVTPALYVESTDEWAMYNVDVSSCYPSVMMFCNSMSRAMRAPERFKEIYLRRIKLKNTPKAQWTSDDKVFVPAAKLVLNTTYGAMGNKYLKLYDDYMRTRVCRVGQMILISIGNHLHTEIPGLKVIQTNTDGILVYARRRDYDSIMRIVDEFSKMTNFLFEVEEDSKLWQLNVNNYIAVHPNGEIKNKGGAFVDSVYQKGTNKLRPLGNFIIQKAQTEFYVNGKNPLEYLLNSTNVSDFCLTCTKGPTYKSMVQYVDYNGQSEIQLGKVSRVIAVTNKEFGVIKKRKIGKEDTCADCPPHPLILNDNLQHYKIENQTISNNYDYNCYNIDYAYYARLLDKALDIPWFEMKDESFKLTTKFNL